MEDRSTLPSDSATQEVPDQDAQNQVSAQPQQTRILGSRKFWIRFILFAVIAGVLYLPVSKFVSQKQSLAFKKRCQAAVEEKDWDSLLETSEKWLAWDPEQNDALMFLAEASVQLGNLEEAEGYLGRVKDSYHGALEALAVRGDILFSDLGRPYDAEECWLRMIQINERADVARQRLIYFYALSLQRQKMVNQIRETMLLQCEPPEAYSYLLMANVLNFSDGLALLTRWRQNSPNDETLEVAQAVYAAKRTSDKAMATFGIQTIIPGDRSPLDHCLEKYPSNIEILSIQIDFLIFKGDAKGVAKLISQVSTDAEVDSRFWRYRGWLFSDRDNFAKAEESLLQALELNPFDWQSRWMLADVLRKLGRPQEADEMSRLGLVGKELQSKLFERPNARELTEELVLEIRDYLQEIGPSYALTALQRRL